MLRVFKNNMKFWGEFKLLLRYLDYSIGLYCPSCNFTQSNRQLVVKENRVCIATKLDIILHLENGK